MGWRLGFAGAPAFAATILRRLIESQHSVDLVYTQPDRPAGRGRKPMPSPVRRVAEIAAIEVRTPRRLHDEARVLGNVDWLVVAAYGLLLPAAILTAPKHHCLNVHASLLPRWRGAAPIERAIMAGDAETGVSIMQIDAGLDTGPVYQRRRLPLDAAATGAAVTEALASLGADALLDVLDALPARTPTPQCEQRVTYAEKLTAKDSLIDWRNSATAIDRQVRALSGRLAAYTIQGDARLRILAAQPEANSRPAPPGTLCRRGRDWRIACGEGALRLLTVQLNRGKGTAQSVSSIANGFPGILFDGARFGTA